MSLIHDLQNSLIDDGNSVGSALLKLRLLSSRLGSDLLEQWVGYELSGYPDEVAVPTYRKVNVSFSGTFLGSFGSGIENAPIPPYLIEKYAGAQWTTLQMRENIAAIEELISSSRMNGDSLVLDFANLILLLQGNIYKDYACNSITGQIGASALVELQSAVRTRALELTIQIERQMPEVASLTSEERFSPLQIADVGAITNITQNIVYGDSTEIVGNSGGGDLTIGIGVGNGESLRNALIKGGFPKRDAEELEKILSSENPESETEPFGKKAQAWLSNNLRKFPEGAWKMGLATGTKLLTEAALKYYGLK